MKCNITCDFPWAMTFQIMKNVWLPVNNKAHHLWLRNSCKSLASRFRNKKKILGTRRTFITCCELSYVLNTSTRRKHTERSFRCRGQLWYTLTRHGNVMRIWNKGIWHHLERLFCTRKLVESVLWTCFISNVNIHCCQPVSTNDREKLYVKSTENDIV